MTPFSSWHEGLRRDIPTVLVEEAFELQKAGALLLDVRELEERREGFPAGSTHLSRGFLEVKVEALEPNPNRSILTLCASGTRSLLAAEALKRLGYAKVQSVDGGFSAWKEAGLPTEVPEDQDPDFYQRYARHLNLTEVGEEGQRRLLASSVLVVGVGGLGSPAAFYLAAAGVGKITLVDKDRVELSNLQRQILHRDLDRGRPKVESGQAALRALNPRLEIDAIPEHLSEANAEGLISSHDLVLDGSDNFATRYLINDHAVRHSKPVVHGSIYKFEGQVASFWAGSKSPQGPCYRCLFPSPPPKAMAPNCAEAGVLGVLPGVIGVLQATEALKLLLDLGRPLLGRLLTYDALAGTFLELQVSPQEDCLACGSKAGVL